MRVLCVFQGCVGGIGRAELLLTQALRTLSPGRALEVETVLKSAYPDYLSDDEPAIRRWPVPRTALGVRTLRRVASLDPDIVILGHLNFAPLAPLIRMVSPRARVVAVAYGDDAWERPRPTVRAALRWIQAVWSISEYTRARFAEASGYPPSRIGLLRLGLTDELLDVIRQSATRIRPKGVILSVSRLAHDVESKGLGHLIEALPAVRRSVPEARLLIAGDGVGRRRLEALAARLAPDGAIQFVGAASTSELARLYGSSDIFALPSLREGFGLVFIEALAAGTPVVAARAGAVPEVVRDGEVGLLCDYGDVPTLAAMITHLVTQREMRDRLARNGVEWVARNYTMRRTTDSVRDLLAIVA
jgi:phosphatidylinositol alpha-1,6-mannosyltransferase